MEMVRIEGHRGHEIGMQILGEWTRLWCRTCRMDLDWFRIPTMQEVYESLYHLRRN